MISNHFDWLNRWHARKQKQDHVDQTFQIETTPEGGWQVNVPLDQASLSQKPFSPVRRQRTQQDFVNCWVEGQDFKATAGARNLSEAIRVLRTWSETKSDGPGGKAA